MRQGLCFVGAVVAALLIAVGVASANAVSVCVVAGGIVIQNVAGIEDQVRIEIFEGDELVGQSSGWKPYPIPGTAFYSISTQLFSQSARYHVILSGSVTDRGRLFDVVRSETEDTGVDNCIGGRIGDGRINDGGDQLAAPMAGYCTDEGGIEIWDIDLSGVGTFDLVVTAAEIADALAVAVANDINQLVGTGTLGNQLWALSNGQLQFHASGLPGEEAKLYDFVFEGDTCA